MKYKLLLLSMMFMAILSCEKNNYYTMDDFFNVEKFDAHYHIYTADDNSIEQASEDNFRLLNINTYLNDCEHVIDAHKGYVRLKEEHGDATAFTATFCLDGWDDPAWTDNTIA